MSVVARHCTLTRMSPTTPAQANGTASLDDRVLLEEGDFLGQKGEDDEVTAFQVNAAARGDANAQMWLGQQYYWGTGGMPRDQVDKPPKEQCNTDQATHTRFHLTGPSSTALPASRRAGVATGSVQPGCHEHEWRRRFAC